jgi:hypothetical protein
MDSIADAPTGLIPRAVRRLLVVRNWLGRHWPASLAWKAAGASVAPGADKFTFNRLAIVENMVL